MIDRINPDHLHILGMVLWVSSVILFVMGTMWLFLPLTVGVGATLAASRLEMRSFRTAGPVKIDGRTHAEWYELIRSMGKEEYEALARPALDGLDGSSEGYGGWDLQKTLGPTYYTSLMRQWYPELYCKHCNEPDCSGNHRKVFSAYSTTVTVVPGKAYKKCNECGTPGCVDCVITLW